MKKIYKKNYLIGLILLVAFIIFTITVAFVDKQAIGPNGSSVGWGTINGFVFNLFKSNSLLFDISDWAGISCIVIMICFAVVGIVQWIKRKSIKKVDRQILLLGVYYITLAILYVLFEKVVINTRPILVKGYLEASYPSSTTLLFCSVVPVSIFEVNRLVSNNITRISLNTSMIVVGALVILGRLISGAHWFTDILGGVLLGFSLAFIYLATTQLILDKQVVINENIKKEKKEEKTETKE